MRASVAIVRRPLWRLRLLHEAPRYLLYAVCVAGLSASARFAIAPPRETARASTPVPRRADTAAEGYAVLFARRYLTWDASAPQSGQQLLEAMAGGASGTGGGGLEADDGLTPSTSGSEQVDWAEVVQSRALGPAAEMYTVAAQTDAAGLVYLAVAVERRADGSLALDGYPAFIGAPAEGPIQAPPRTPEVRTPALTAVVRRGLSNYLAGSREELSADLARNARVSLPAVGLTLEALQGLAWSSRGRSVYAVVRARDRSGTRYTLGYELDVIRPGGRWEISAIQMDPDA